MIRVKACSPSALAAIAAVIACLACSASLRAQDRGGRDFERFVRRDGDVLRDGDAEFRFISFNIPNLHYVEDDMRFERSMPFRFPDEFEIHDALGAIEQIGGRVVRCYALSVRKADDPPDQPRHILGPGQFNEEAFLVMDRVLSAAREHRVRVIIPFVDQWSWWGGMAELAAFRGKKLEDCWTDRTLIDDFKGIVSWVVGRKNTVTGVKYADDPTILAWETGNEIAPPAAWTREIAAHLKSVDPRHLVIDGAHRRTLLESSLEDPNVDFVQTHHYERDPREMIANIRESARLARGKKPYHVGEFGFLGTEALRAVMDAVLEEKVTGALLWSLRYRTRDGGFYWHHEPAGGDRFKAYHWPGFEIGESYDERGLLRIVREKAFEIRGLAPPPLPAPAPPRLLSVSAGGQLTWQGSVGAWSYDVERAESTGGPWSVVAVNVSEAQVQHRPLFVDEAARPGVSYSYRVIAKSPSGSSQPSNAMGPVRITHRTLVDELWNDSRIFLQEGKTQFRENEARKFKEDCHRLSGEKKSAIIYRGRGGIQAVRVFAFSPTEAPGLRIAFSADCRRFEPAEPGITRFKTHGESAYGFWKALLYEARPKGPALDYVRIEFESESQVSRVEIDHDGAGS